MNRTVTFEEQDHSEEELLYCPNCVELGEETGQLSIIDENQIGFCPDCFQVHNYDECVRKPNLNIEESQYLIPLKDIYSTTLIVEQGGFSIGDKREIKYRTTLMGTISETDELMNRIRNMKPMNEGELIRLMKAGAGAS